MNSFITKGLWFILIVSIMGAIQQYSLNEGYDLGNITGRAEQYFIDKGLNLTHKEVK